MDQITRRIIGFGVHVYHKSIVEQTIGGNMLKSRCGWVFCSQGNGAAAGLITPVVASEQIDRDAHTL